MDDATAVNSVLYALSTIAQTCAALAALVGALALYRLQAMRDAHAAQERSIRELASGIMARDEALSGPRDRVLEVAHANIDRPGFREALDEFHAHDDRYARAIAWFIAFEAWNLAAILASLLGFTCVSWLASHWWWFAGLLIFCSLGTVAVTGGALLLSARRYAPWADRLLDGGVRRGAQLRRLARQLIERIPQRFSQRR